MAENDVKIPGIAIHINSTVMITALIALGGLWWRVDSMATDVKANADHPVSEARMAVMENEVGHIRDTVTRIEAKQASDKREILAAIKDSGT